MYQLLLKFKENGECCWLGHMPKNYELKDNESTVKSNDFNIHSHHKEHFNNSSYKLSLIKKKSEKLLSKNYIYGLNTGWQKDQEYKNWCESIINFTNSFKNKIINENKIEFPEDPWGNIEVLSL